MTLKQSQYPDQIRKRAGQLRMNKKTAGDYKPVIIHPKVSFIKSRLFCYILFLFQFHPIAQGVTWKIK
jgi:hypothetical protein